MFCQRCSRLPGPSIILRLVRASIRSSSHLAKSTDPTKLVNLDLFTPDKIRNFCIVAHVDHGKSTLADRLMELTGVVEPGGEKQLLDKLQVERERGITVKAQTCSMVHNGHLLNLIDTPGHVDFSFEVSRSLVACDGILLVVAANEGVQAQTVANFWLAFNQNLHMIPLINKVDLTPAKVDQVELQLKTLFELEKEDCIRISAKTGLNVTNVLDAIIERIPPPKAERDARFRAVIFDSWFEHFRGAIAFILVKEGSVEKGQKIKSFHSKKEYEVIEIGVMHPEMSPCQKLYAGQVGYIIANMRTVQEAGVGETLFDPTITDVVPFPGFAPVKPNVFSGLFPVDVADYEGLKQALDRLCLNDPSVLVKPDSSPALGLGWRVGFLGLLHMEVFGQRLDQEYDASVILTAPTVQYKAKIVDNDTIRKKRHNGKAEITITDSSQFPEHSDVQAFLEPMVKLTTIIPSQYMSPVMALCSERRGVQGTVTSIDEDRMLIVFRIPLAEIVVDFFEQLKFRTSGYASMDYEDDGYDETDLAKVTVSINGRPIDEFSMITPMAMARDRAKLIVRRLRREIPQQQYDVDIKATVGGKVVAGTLIHAMRKDFTQQLKGNLKDMSRLKKKLAHQAKGKKRMKELGRIQIPKEAFINVLREND